MDFKNYIFKTLRWPLCLNPGPIASVVHGLARVFNSVVADIEWLRDQFNPATCELQYLAPLAESRGITRHRLETDNDKFRQRVVKAFAWQLLGGKSAGMPVLLKHFGYETDEPINVRSEDVERWAEFRIEMDSPETVLQNDYELLLWAINESKPARSKLESIRFRSVLEKEMYTGGKIRTGDVQHIPHRFGINVNPIQVYSGVGITQADIINIGIRESNISVAPTSLYMGIALQQAEIINIPVREV